MRWERLTLVIALVCLFIHMSRRAIISFTRFDVTYWFSILGVFFLTLSVLRYRKVYRVAPLPASYSILLTLYLLYVLLMGVVGYLKGHVFTYMAAEAMIFYVVALCMIAGRYDQFWRDLQKPALVLFWIGLVIVVANLNRPTVEISEEGVKTGQEIKEQDYRAEVASLGYDLQPYLSLWPVLFALAYQSRRTDWLRVTGLLVLVGYLAVSIVFLKRAPVARTVAYAVVIVFASGVLQRRLRMRTALLTIAGMFIACVIVGGVYLNNLKQRYETGEREARVSEAQSLLEDMHGAEWVFGKGLGGYFEPPPGWKAGVVYVNYLGAKGRTTLHIGLFLPLLKGGIILMALYYVFFVRLMWFKTPQWNQLDINFAARAVVPVYLLFQLIEGPPSQTDPLTAIMAGICCARASVPAEEPERLPLESHYDDAYAVGDVGAAADGRLHQAW
jgi:hypothetical protein